MANISHASLLKGSGPTQTQANVAMEMLAQRTGGNLQVAINSSGTKVNGSTLSTFLSKNTISKDTVSFSPAATASISRQQVALSVIEASQGTTKNKAVTEKSQQSAGSAVAHIAAQAKAASDQTLDDSASPLGESIIGTQDPASVIAAYMKESPTERYYGAVPDPTTLSNEFFSSSEQQASYIAAYNDGSLNIQAIGQFLKGDADSITNFTSSGSSSYASGSNELDLSSIKADNIFTLSDPIAGGIVITWNNKR